MAAPSDTTPAGPTMRRAQFTGKGLDHVEVVTVPRARRKEGEYLVKVEAAGLNPTDWKHAMQGHRYYTMSKASPATPVVLGCEGFGTVVEAPASSRTALLPVGTRVFFFAHNACAEFASIPAAQLGVAPASMSAAQAAGTPLALLTAYQALRDGGVSEPGCGKGRSILVHGGSGGVGHFALQLARAFSFERIVTTASAGNAPFVKEMGATQCVDYKAEDFVALFKGPEQRFDVAFDAIGGDPVGCGGICARPGIGMYQRRTRQVVKTSGTSVGVLTGASFDGPCGQGGGLCCSLPCGLVEYKCASCFGCGPRYAGPYFIPTAANTARAGADLSNLSKQFIEPGKVTTTIHKTFPLEETRAALELLMGNGFATPQQQTTMQRGQEGQQRGPFRGKVVVTM